MRNLALVLLSVAGLVGCSVEDFVTNDNSSVLFLIADINGGAALKSDVRLNGSVFNDLAKVTLAVRPKNQLVTTLPQVPMAVIVERYEIRYYRSDGRGTPGVDVPYTISGNLTTAVDASTDSARNVQISLEFVRVQAKLEPPLTNLTTSGQAIILTVFAEVTIHGKTIAGEGVKATGVLQINFADWADDTTTTT